MKNKKQDKQLEKLLFEVYEKGVKQQDCNLTEYIKKVKQALRIHDVMQRSEQLIDFFKWLNNYEELQYTEKGIQFYVDDYLKSINCA